MATSPTTLLFLVDGAGEAPTLDQTSPALQSTRFRSPQRERTGTMPSLTALRCVICAQQVPLSTDEPIAAAEIATFIAAHAQHDRMAVEIVLPPAHVQLRG